MLSFDWFLLIVCFGLGLSLLLGSLGCFLIWKRMSFFGDSLAHSAFLGVSISFILNINIYFGLLVISILMSLVLNYSKNSSHDTKLALVSYFAFSLGILLAQKFAFKIDPNSYLFGDILSTDYRDLILIYCTAFGAITYIFINWNKLILWTLDRDLAFVDGVNIKKISNFFMLFLSITIGFSLKSIGSLMVAPLLIIPATTARYISNTPKKMLINSILICFIIYNIGLGGSIVLDLSTAPTITIVGILFMVCTRLIVKIYRKNIGFFGTMKKI
jgi:zinc transport system permease protein